MDRRRQRQYPLGLKYVANIHSGETSHTTKLQSFIQPLEVNRMKSLRSTIPMAKFTGKIYPGLTTSVVEIQR